MLQFHCYSRSATVVHMSHHIATGRLHPAGPELPSSPTNPKTNPKPTGMRHQRLPVGFSSWRSPASTRLPKLAVVVSCQRDCFTPTYAVNAISMHPVNRPICIWKYCKDAVCVHVDFCSVILLLISRFHRCNPKKRSRF